MHDNFGFKFLLASRAIRSVAIVYMTLAIPLYLSLLKFSAIKIGLIFLAIMLFNAFIVLLLGFIGDLYSYKKSLLIAELLPMLAGIIIGLSSSHLLIILAMVIGSIGGAAGGMRGAFSPGTTALIANNWHEEGERVSKLGQLAAIAPLFSIVGGLLVSAHALLQASVGGIEAFKILYLFSGAMMLASFVLILLVKEAKVEKKKKISLKPESYRYLSRIVVSNALQGAGIGVAIPLLPLWLEMMYHANTFSIGLLFSASYLMTALGSYASSRISSHFNLLNISSRTRVLGGALLVVMAFMPSMALAALLYAARALVSGFGSPTRSTVNVRGIDKEDYGTASSIQGLASRLAQTSSGLSGYMLEYSMPLPLFAGGILQLFGGIAYGKLLRYKDIGGASV